MGDFYKLSGILSVWFCRDVLCLLVQLPIDDRQYSYHEYKRADATSKDGDAYRYPERRAAQYHRDYADGSGSCGQEDWYHSATTSIEGCLADSQTFSNHLVGVLKDKNLVTHDNAHQCNEAKQTCQAQRDISNA